MASGVYLTFFASFVFGKPGFPFSDVPLQSIAADVEAGRYSAKPTQVFRFEEIQEAHRVMESNEAKGKRSGCRARPGRTPHALEGRLHYCVEEVCGNVENLACA